MDKIFSSPVKANNAGSNTAVAKEATSLFLGDTRSRLDALNKKKKEASGKDTYKLDYSPLQEFVLPLTSSRKQQQ